MDAFNQIVSSILSNESVVFLQERKEQWLNYMRKNPIVKKISLFSGIFVSFFALRYVMLKLYRKRQKAVPGMFGVPIFGSMFTAAIYGRKFLYNLIPSYGVISQFSIGNLPIIMINDPKILKSIFSCQEARIRPTAYQTLLPDDIGLSFAQINDKHYWKLRRQFMLSSVISIANRQYIDKQVNKVLNSFIYNWIDECIAKNKKWQAKDDLRHGVFNVVFGAIFGEQHQLDRNDKEFEKINENVHLVFENADMLAIAVVFPWLSTIGVTDLLTKGKLKQIKDAWIEIYEIVQRKIDQGIEEYNVKIENNKKEDFTYFDELYDKIQKHHKNEKSMIISDDMLKADLFVMLSASMDTTGNSLHIALYIAAKYFNIQNEIYQELKDNACIESNNNGKRIFDLTKLTDCPKFRAFISEALRLASVATVGEVHSLTHDCKLTFEMNDKNEVDCISFNPTTTNHKLDDKVSHGNKKYEYILPKGCWMVPNLAYMHRVEEKYWSKGGKNANELNLDYWLNKKNGKLTYQKDSNFMVFSTGVRSCPGETLAMKEMYAILGNLFLNYQFIGPNGKDKDFHVPLSEAFVACIDPDIGLTVIARS